jgi:hypothetical protein
MQIVFICNEQRSIIVAHQNIVLTAVFATDGTGSVDVERDVAFSVEGYATLIA